MSQEQTPPVNGWVGSGSTWNGDVAFDGRVRVDGTLVGSVRSPDLLEIGPQGRVEGTVEVAQALVGGTVVGTLKASERVTVLESGRVEGEVHTPWLDVRLGATLDAKVVVTR